MTPKVEVYHIECSLCKKLHYLLKDYVFKPIRSFADFLKRKLL